MNDIKRRMTIEEMYQQRKINWKRKLKEIELKQMKRKQHEKEMKQFGLILEKNLLEMKMRIDSFGDDTESKLQHIEMIVDDYQRCLHSMEMKVNKTERLSKLIVEQNDCVLKHFNIDFSEKQFTSKDSSISFTISNRNGKVHSFNHFGNNSNNNSNNSFGNVNTTLNSINSNTFTNAINSMTSNSFTKSSGNTFLNTFTNPFTTSLDISSPTSITNISNSISTSTNILTSLNENKSNDNNSNSNNINQTTNVINLSTKSLQTQSLSQSIEKPETNQLNQLNQINQLKQSEIKEIKETNKNINQTINGNTNIIEIERISTYNQQIESTMQTVEKWTSKTINQIIFDSTHDDWDVKTSVFDEKIMNKSQVVILIETTSNVIIGQYLNTIINKRAEKINEKWTGSIFDKNSFVFGNYGGQLKKYHMKQNKSKALDLWPNYHKQLLTMGHNSVYIYKKSVAARSHCQQDDIVTYDFGSTNNALYPSSNSFNIRHIIVYQLQ